MSIGKYEHKTYTHSSTIQYTYWRMIFECTYSNTIQYTYWRMAYGCTLYTYMLIQYLSYMHTSDSTVYFLMLYANANVRVSLHPNLSDTQPFRSMLKDTTLIWSLPMLCKGLHMDSASACDSWFSCCSSGDFSTLWEHLTKAKPADSKSLSSLASMALQRIQRIQRSEFNMFQRCHCITFEIETCRVSLSLHDSIRHPFRRGPLLCT